MTVIRALKKYGYYTSYNRNAGYYVLHDVPEFNEWGLWTYRDIRFSKYGTLTQTIVALCERIARRIDRRRIGRTLGDEGCQSRFASGSRRLRPA